MSYEEAEVLMQNFDKTDARVAKQGFIHKMSRKVTRKEPWRRK